MTSWHTIGGHAQVALSWVVNVGGPTGARAYSSDLVALASLEADGLARHDADDDTWRATDRGRAVYHERHEPFRFEGEPA